MRQALSIVALSAVLGAGGCSDDHAHEHPSCGVQANCTGDEVTPGPGALAIASDGGSFRAVFHEASDFRVAAEGTAVTADWALMLQDADESPVTDATLTVSTWSVDCLHGGPTADATVTANAEGRYEVQSVYAHGGPWETRILVEAGDVTDMIHVPVCSPGEEHPGTHGGEDHAHEHDAE
jgi:hypothetical protein